jgi:hypothetical protein
MGKYSGARIHFIPVFPSSSLSEEEEAYHGCNQQLKIGPAGGRDVFRSLPSHKGKSFSSRISRRDSTPDVVKTGRGTGGSRFADSLFRQGRILLGPKSMEGTPLPEQLISLTGLENQLLAQP